MAATTEQKKRKAISAEPKSSKKPRTSKSATSAPTTQDVAAGQGASVKSKKTTTADEITFEPEASEAEASASDAEDQVTALLKGFEDDSDVEDEEGGGGVEVDNAFDTANLPDPSTALASIKSTILTKSKHMPTDSSDPTGLYISRIPHGFFEPQMRAYFSQFGDVKHLRLARNRRTGASKHYAFLEYESAEVASIVQRTMNNYLMFKHILKVELLPKEKVHAELWKGADSRFRKVPWNRIEKTRVAKTDRMGWGKRLEREEKSRAEKAEKMKALGYNFEAPKLREVGSVPVQALEAPEIVKAIEAPNAAGGVKAADGADAAQTAAKITATTPIKEVTSTKRAKGKDGVKASKSSRRAGPA